MLREATPSALNDAARLDAIETAFPDLRRREADDDAPMPPKIAGAAAMRSQRVPGPEIIAAAWRGLPVALQHTIGSTALGMVFADWLASDSDYAPAERWFTDAAVGQAVQRSDDALRSLEETARHALPSLFGAGGEAPDWSALGRPVAASPLVAALGHLKEVERTRPAGVTSDNAREWAAYYAVLGAPLQTRADLAALQAHFKPSLDAPADCLMAKAFEALALALGIEPVGAEGERNTTAIIPATGADCLLSPIQAGIALHRQAWAALQARAEFLKAAAWSDREAVSWPEDDVEAEAFTDLFLVACRDRSDARRLVGHLAWREAVQVQHPRRGSAELSAQVLAQVATRRADLALILGEPVTGAAPSLPAGELAARIEAHRAAWTAHSEAPDSEGVWAAQEAADAVLVAPCADRAEAAALVAHAQWYGAELAATGDAKRDCLELDGKQMAARAEELALVTADSVGRLAA